MPIVTRRTPLAWGCMIPNAYTLRVSQCHSLHTLSGGSASISLFNSNNISDGNSFFYIQSRGARYRPKRLFLPSIKKKYKKPVEKKYHMFSDDTLHSISHGEDWYVKVHRSDFMKKLS